MLWPTFQSFNSQSYFCLQYNSLKKKKQEWLFYLPILLWLFYVHLECEASKLIHSLTYLFIYYFHILFSAIHLSTWDLKEEKYMVILWLVLFWRFAIPFLVSAVTYPMRSGNIAPWSIILQLHAVQPVVKVQLHWFLTDDECFSEERMKW